MISSVCAFIGYISYYKRLIHLFVSIYLLLTTLLKKPPKEGTNSIWTKVCTIAFEKLKQKLALAPILIVSG